MMRGQTIKFDNVRRSTKHLKIGRIAFPAQGMQKWNALFEEYTLTEDNAKKYGG